MLLSRVSFVSALLVFAAMGCATAKFDNHATAAKVEPHGASTAVWFNGSVEKAFETAMVGKKPIFLTDRKDKEPPPLPPSCWSHDGGRRCEATSEHGHSSARHRMNRNFHDGSVAQSEST